MSPRFRLMLVAMVMMGASLLYLGMRDVGRYSLMPRQSCPTATCPLAASSVQGQIAEGQGGSRVNPVVVEEMHAGDGEAPHPLKGAVKDLVYRGPNPTGEDYKCFSPQVVVPGSDVSDMHVPVCVFPKADDVWVSGALYAGHLWEQDAVTALMERLLRVPGAGFIDIGANIGVYTLTAAALGRPVVAVEPMIKCVRRMYRATQLANSTERVTFVNGAVSNVTGRLFMAVDRQNKGGSFVTDLATCRNMAANPAAITACDMSNPIHTFVMDELLAAVTFKVAGMKVDAETHEPEVFARADKFFTAVDVRFVQMEWAMPPRYYKAQDADGVRRAKNLLAFFLRHKYTPYLPKTTDKLNPDEWMSWPVDVFWIK